MTTNIAQLAEFQFNQLGLPLTGGKLFTYAAGTTNKLATYTDSTGLVPNTNPIILDSNGQCSLWLPNAVLYKFTLSPANDTDPPTNPFWTQDNQSSALVTGGTVTSISIASANGFSGSVSSPTTDPILSIGTSVSGVLKGNSSGIAAAVAGTDYVIPSGSVATVTAAAQPAITSVGTLSGLTVTAPIAGSVTGNAGTASNAIGYGQTWQNVVGVRSLGVTYTNSTGRPIVASLQVGGPNPGGSVAVVDGITVGAVNIGIGSATTYGQLVLIIPSGSTYSVTGGTLITWAELR